MPKSKGENAKPEWFKHTYSTNGELEILRKDLNTSLRYESNDDVKKMTRLLLKKYMHSASCPKFKGFF